MPACHLALFAFKVLRDNTSCKLGDIHNLIAMAMTAVGFRNLGTSCFLNAGLQALFGVSDLVKSINDGGTTDEVALQRLLARMADTHQAVVPAEITNRYYHGRQEDITEFLGKILEKCVGCHEILCGKERSSFQCQHCGYRRSLQVILIGSQGKIALNSRF